MPARQGVGHDLCPFNETADKQFPSAVAIFSVKDRRDMCYLIDVSRIRGQYR